MKEYEEMYYRLFNRVTDAVHLLQQAQQEAEEHFLAAGELKVAEKEKEEK